MSEIESHTGSCQLDLLSVRGVRSDNLNVFPRYNLRYDVSGGASPAVCSMGATFGQLDQFDQAADFRLWLGLHQLLELVGRQMIFQIPDDIKVLPPAVQDFKTGLLMVAAYFAVLKRYGIAQSRATPHQFWSCTFHQPLNFHLSDRFSGF